MLIDVYQVLIFSSSFHQILFGFQRPQQPWPGRYIQETVYASCMNFFHLLFRHVFYIPSRRFHSCQCLSALHYLLLVLSHWFLQKNIKCSARRLSGPTQYFMITSKDVNFCNCKARVWWTMWPKQVTKNFKNALCDGASSSIHGLTKMNVTRVRPPCCSL